MIYPNKNSFTDFIIFLQVLKMWALKGHLGNSLQVKTSQQVEIQRVVSQFSTEGEGQNGHKEQLT